jgi:hypothetical protein
MNKVSCEDILKQAIQTHKERGAVYGNAYLEQHGKVMKALFPNGLVLSSADDFNRFGTFNMIVSKMTRYANNLRQANTHIDSLHDMGVYSFMLEEIDRIWIDKQE